MSHKIRLFSIFVALMLMAGIGSAANLELCPGGAFVGSGALGVTITTAPGGAQCKAKDYDDPNPGGTVYGLGVSGATPGEIDVSETLTLDFSGIADGNSVGLGSVVIQEFDIIVFYNGPEFGDPQEKGRVSVVWDDGSSSFYEFTADAQPSTTGISWTGSGFASNVSPMTENNAGWFNFAGLPFGVTGPTANRVRSLTFTAISQPGGTNNNSDYALKSVLFTEANVEVPEPSTYALLGLGLLGLAAIRRRRSA